MFQLETACETGRPVGCAIARAKRSYDDAPLVVWTLAMVAMLLIAPLVG